MSAIIGLFAILGAVAAFRWAFGGKADARPTVDLVTERINSRAGVVDRTGAEGARAALYPSAGFEVCRTCHRLHKGGHGYAGHVEGRASGPACLPPDAALPERAKVVPIRRAS